MVQRKIKKCRKVIFSHMDEFIVYYAMNNSTLINKNIFFNYAIPTKQAFYSNAQSHPASTDIPAYILLRKMFGCTTEYSHRELNVRNSTYL